MAYNNNITPILDSSADLFDSEDDDDCLAALNGTEKKENHGQLCRESICSISNLKTEIDDVNSSLFTCPFCDSIESSINNLECHIEAVHSEVKSEKNKLLPHEKSLGHGLRQSPHKLWASMTGHGNGSFVCPLCDMTFESEPSLNVHIDSDHKNEIEGMPSSSSATKNCPICDEAFQSEIELEHHVEGHFSSPKSKHVRAEASANSIQSFQSQCPICEFNDNDYALLVSHVESHFDSNHMPGTSSSSSSSSGQDGKVLASSSQSRFNSTSSSVDSRLSVGNGKPHSSKNKNAYQDQYRKNLEKSVVNGEVSPTEYHELMSEMKKSHHLGTDEGHSKVEGLYENMAATYHSLRHPRKTANLCDPTDYYCGSYGDKGWGCGFRNLQMLISCLVRKPSYTEKLFPDGNAQVPSICKLQEMIEGAWQKGFDLEGCEQLEGKLIGTRKWIGATEVVATLSSKGIKCILADFHVPSADDGTHPKLLEWVYNYFSKDTEHKPPLYLQHQGHSRTIAGVEMDNGTIKLIIFDPATPYNRIAHLGQAPLEPKHLRTFRRSQASFKAKQYQVVAVVGLLTSSEYEDSKVLYSTQVS